MTPRFWFHIITSDFHKLTNCFQFSFQTVWNRYVCYARFFRIILPCTFLLSIFLRHKPLSFQISFQTSVAHCLSKLKRFIATQKCLCKKYCCRKCAANTYCTFQHCVWWTSKQPLAFSHATKSLAGTLHVLTNVCVIQLHANPILCSFIPFL